MVKNNDDDEVEVRIYYMCIKGYSTTLFRIVQVQVVVALTLQMMTFPAPVMTTTKMYVVLVYL